MVQAVSDQLRRHHFCVLQGLTCREHKNAINLQTLSYGRGGTQTKRIRKRFAYFLPEKSLAHFFLGGLLKNNLRLLLKSILITALALAAHQNDTITTDINDIQHRKWAK